MIACKRNEIKSDITISTTIRLSFVVHWLLFSSIAVIYLVLYLSVYFVDNIKNDKNSVIICERNKLIEIDWLSRSDSWSIRGIQSRMFCLLSHFFSRTSFLYTKNESSNNKQWSFLLLSAWMRSVPTILVFDIPLNSYQSIETFATLNGKLRLHWNLLWFCWYEFEFYWNGCPNLLTLLTCLLSVVFFSILLGSIIFAFEYLNIQILFKANRSIIELPTGKL